MQSNERIGVPPVEQADFVSRAIARALDSGLEGIQAQMERVARAEQDRAEALRLLRKVSRRGKQGKSSQRAGARDSQVWQPVFLAALQLVPNVRLACDAACISQKTAYRHRNDDPAFREQWEEAERAGVALLHATAFQRAVIGIIEPIYQGGVRVGHRRVYSDRLLELLLKGHMPEMFRENHAVAMKAEVVVEEVKREQENMTPARVREITNAMLPKLMAIMNQAPQ